MSMQQTNNARWHIFQCAFVGILLRFKYSVNQVHLQAQEKLAKFTCCMTRKWDKMEFPASMVNKSFESVEGTSKLE